MAWVIGIGIALFLLFNFPRQALGFVALISLVAAAGGVYWLASNAKENSIKDLIIIDAHWNQSACYDPEYPINVVFQNNSKRVITKLWFSLEGRRPGYSDPISSSAFLYSDKILAIGETYGGCWAFDKPFGKTIYPANLDWIAKISSVNYK